MHRTLRIIRNLYGPTSTYSIRSEVRRSCRIRAPAAGGSTAEKTTARAYQHHSRGEKRSFRRSAHRGSEVERPMEVEVKIRLPDRDAYERVSNLLGAPRVTHQQENFFFDGAKQELRPTKTVVRLRFYDIAKKAVITVKGKQILKDGIGTASEVEEDVEPVHARNYLEKATPMLVESPLLKGLNEQWGIQELICMGGFRNCRQEHVWEGVLVELDETSFEHGTLYEIECETDQPEVFREKLESLLSSNSIQYKYSAASKFANFINKSLL